MKKTIPIVVVIIVLALGAIFILSRTNIANPEFQEDVELSELDSQEMSEMEETDQDLGTAVDQTFQTEVAMAIQDFAYELPNIVVTEGTTVTWTNLDTERHNVMLDHDHDEVAHDPLDIHEVNENELAGPLLATGESYSFTFKEVGAYPYHCSPHPFMNGSVTVVE